MDKDGARAEVVAEVEALDDGADAAWRAFMDAPDAPGVTDYECAAFYGGYRAALAAMLQKEDADGAD